MAQVEIEPVGPEGSHKSGQEVGDILYLTEEGNRKNCTLKLLPFQLLLSPCKMPDN